MKKILLITAALLVSTSAFSQKFQWGFKGGLNLSNLSNSDMYLDLDELGDLKMNSKMKPSFYIGAFVEFRINDYFGIQPELLYSRQGVKYKETMTVEGVNVDIKAWMKLNYINLPVIAKIYVLDNLSIDLGPQFGYLAGVKSKYEVSAPGMKKEDDDDSKDGLKDFDVSFAMGATYKIANKIDITARYNLGLTKVNDTDGDKAKNGVIQIGVGYRF